MDAVTAVTFDYWNTLAYEDRGELRGLRAAAWAGVLEDAGFACEREQIDAVFEASWERFMHHWTTNQQYHAAQAAEECVEALGFEVPDDIRAALVAAFSDAGQRASLHPTDGVGECIRTLKDAGVRVGIICDVGFTPSTVLRAHLDQWGLLGLFDHWSFSDEVGVYKPSPVIFEHALAGLGGVEPASAAHVGDLRRTDVAGAIGMGMTAVRYTGVFDDAESDAEPEAHHVIASHADLPKVLGIL